MHAMSTATLAIITTTMAGLFGLSGAFIGYWTGRRQTADQATVEHLQWLRGQRQQAYVAFLDAWDTSVESLAALQTSWESWVAAYEQGDRSDDPAEASSRVLNDAWHAVRKEIERVELLGPQRIDVAVRALEDLFGQMRRVITEQADDGATCAHWDEWYPVLNRAAVARFDFHAAAVQTLRQPPSPKGEREGLEQ
jgi:hypothetical protein